MQGDIRDIFGEAMTALADATAGTAEVYVFLDEINTCPYMGLMCEAICHLRLDKLVICET